MSKRRTLRRRDIGTRGPTAGMVLAVGGWRLHNPRRFQLPPFSDGSPSIASGIAHGW